MLIVNIAGDRETVLKAYAQELWISFGFRDFHERADKKLWVYAGGIDKFSDGGNVTLEPTQEDGINDRNVCNIL